MSDFNLLVSGARDFIHNPNARELYSKLEEYLVQLYEDKPDLVIYTPLAEGFDEAATKIAQRNEIPYELMISNTNFGIHYWQNNSLIKRNRIEIWDDLVSNADQVYFICGNSVFMNGVHSNFIRNGALVEKCHEALLYQPSSNNTKDIVRRLGLAGKSYRVFEESGEVSALIGPPVI